MSTITKQWLRQKIAEMEAARDEIPFGLDEDDSNTLEALRIALASLEATPVAWRNKDSGHCGTLYIQGKSPIDCGYEPLYMAPPAPVSMPDESSVELLATDLMKRIDKITGERHSVATLSSLRVSILNACRAAMLQGVEPVSNRDELPDDWVACSERMPDEGSKVIVFRPHAEESNDPPVKTATYKGGREYYHGFDCYCEPTHWMPLPASPLK